MWVVLVVVFALLGVGVIANMVWTIRQGLARRRAERTRPDQRPDQRPG